MTELPRFEPRQDSRPDDVQWQPATWPVDPATVLRGRYVELKPLIREDVAELFAALDHDAVWTHLAGRTSTAEAMESLMMVRVNDPAWQPWTVRVIDDYCGFKAGSIVGSTSFLETSPLDSRTEIGGTMYSPAVWSSHVNPECKFLLLQFAFERLGMGRVQLKTDIRNVRSQQAIARLGATFEGVLRRYQRRTDDTVRDTVLFSITAEEWPQVRDHLQGRLRAE
jgi:RimJ/RimL family protein N-acetyltransferase